ncbi:MAG: dihydroorotase [Chromatiales bacterium]|jgi:dihydroorotase|nr:dihydroorotase [Chromatiales bacterium]
MRIELRGGRVVDPATGHDDVTNLFIEDGRICAIGHRSDFAPMQIVDATGLVVCPGFIELSAHIPTGEAAINTELRAATVGGVTTVCIPPRADLLIDSPAAVELVHRRADASRLARVEVFGALTAGLKGEQLGEMYTLAQAGCPAVSNGLEPIRSTEVMRRALEYAATFDLTVLLHCRDPWLSEGRIVHGGRRSFDLGFDAEPEASETVAVARDLLLIEQIGARAHFCRLTTARAVNMVSDARARGLRVSADVGMPYLFLTDDDIDGFDARCHVRPPLRTHADRATLGEALADARINCLTADHQPHGPDAKMNPFSDTAPGISGLDSLLPLALRWMKDHDVPLLRGLATLTSEPANVLGLERGSLAPGSVADVCLFDPRANVTIDSSTFISHGHNTPFDGMKLCGRVLGTYVDGRLVHRSNELQVANQAA